MADAVSEYFIRIDTYGTQCPDIINAETMVKAMDGLNYLNPDDYEHLCWAEDELNAENYYFEELSELIFTRIAERDHP